jgi:hypothetical protein
VNDFVRNLVLRGAGLVPVIHPAVAPTFAEERAEEPPVEAEDLHPSATQPTPPVPYPVPNPVAAARSEVPAKSPAQRIVATPPAPVPIPRPQKPQDPGTPANRLEPTPKMPHPVEPKPIVSKVKLQDARPIDATAEPAVPDVSEEQVVLSDTHPLLTPAIVAALEEPIERVLIERRVDISTATTTAAYDNRDPVKSAMAALEPVVLREVGSNGALPSDADAPQTHVDVHIGRIEIIQSAPPPQPAFRPRREPRGFAEHRLDRAYLSRRWY